jgi:hypothetical protein
VVTIVLGCVVDPNYATLDTSGKYWNGDVGLAFSAPPPRLGDKRIVGASYGVAGIRLGKPGSFDLGKAAVVNFANAAGGPLSPLSMTTGVANIADAMEAGFEVGKQIPGNFFASPADAAANLLSQAGNLLDHMGPYQAFTIVETQTFTERSSFFGLFTHTEWVNDAPTYTSVNTGPLAGGFYVSPNDAAASAYRALILQLQNQ